MGEINSFSSRVASLEQYSKYDLESDTAPLLGPNAKKPTLMNQLRKATSAQGLDKSIKVGFKEEGLITGKKTGKFKKAVRKMLSVLRRIGSKMSKHLKGSISKSYTCTFSQADFDRFLKPNYTANPIVKPPRANYTEQVKQAHAEVVEEFCPLIEAEKNRNKSNNNFFSQDDFDKQDDFNKLLKPTHTANPIPIPPRAKEIEQAKQAQAHAEIVQEFCPLLEAERKLEAEFDEFFAERMLKSKFEETAGVDEFKNKIHQMIAESRAKQTSLPASQDEISKLFDLLNEAQSNSSPAIKKEIIRLFNQLTNDQTKLVPLRINLEGVPEKFNSLNNDQAKTVSLPANLREILKEFDSLEKKNLDHYSVRIDQNDGIVESTHL